MTKVAKKEGNMTKEAKKEGNMTKVAKREENITKSANKSVENNVVADWDSKIYEYHGHP